MKTSINTQSNRSTMKALIILMAIFVTALTQSVQAQNTYKVAPGSQIKVSGTSNLHDWTMQASSFSAEGDLIVKNGQLEDVASLNFALPVTNLKSKEDLMNTRAYKALNAEKFNRITFKLTEASILPQQKIKASGNLTISGVTKQISLVTSYVLNADESIVIKGTKAVKMSDHNIKAPVFMMGALKTGDEVMVDILLKLKK